MRFTKEINQVNREGKTRFRKKPKIRTVKNHPIDMHIRFNHKNGHTKSARVHIPKAMMKKKKYAKILKVIVRHELREIKFYEAYPHLASSGLGHVIAKSKEAEDLRRVHLSKRTYEKQTKRLGYRP
jgi:hypothetical protein